MRFFPFITHFSLSWRTGGKELIVVFLLDEETEFKTTKAVVN